MKNFRKILCLGKYALLAVLQLGCVMFAQGCANPMIASVKRGEVGKVAAYLDAKKQPDKGVDSQGNTLLHLAATDGKKEIAELLLAQGATLDATNKLGWTPLHSAVMAGADEVAGVLLSKGAAANTLTKEGWNLWHVYGTSGKGLSIIQMAMGNGAVLYAGLPDRNGVTPLMLAAAFNQTNA